MRVTRALVALFVLAALAIGKSTVLGCGGDGESVARRTAEMNVQAIADLVRAYRRHHDGVVPSWHDLMTPDAHGIRALRCDVVPRDPWGHEYRIEPEDGSELARIVSWGPDGLAGTADDVASPSARP